VDFADLVTPVTSADWYEGKFSTDESSLNSDLNFFSKFDSETNVSSVITNNDDGLETCALTGLGLFLNGDNLHYFITELIICFLNEFVNDGCLLDWNGVSIDFL